MLEAANLTCLRGERLLFSALNLTLSPGEILHVAGPNGSGKTTLLRTLCGLSQPETGTVRWQGAPARGEAFHSQLLYLGHQPALKEELTALENLRFAAELADAPLSDAQALDALVQIGLGEREHLPAKVLSQGQKRRVLLARLLVSDAPLWMLDEPLTALDTIAVSLIQERLAAHLDAQGMVILTTHQTLAIPRHTPRRLDLGQAT